MTDDKRKLSKNMVFREFLTRNNIFKLVDTISCCHNVKIYIFHKFTIFEDEFLALKKGLHDLGAIKD